jgi:hypothetical protein
MPTNAIKPIGVKLIGCVKITRANKLIRKVNMVEKYRKVSMVIKVVVSKNDVKILVEHDKLTRIVNMIRKLINFIKSTIMEKPT